MLFAIHINGINNALNDATSNKLNALLYDDDLVIRPNTMLNLQLKYVFSKRCTNGVGQYSLRLYMCTIPSNGVVKIIIENYFV